MPLKCFTRDQTSTKFDIVAVPAIGADPVFTFRYPGLAQPNPKNLTRWKHIFSPISGARVFLYTFDRPQDSGTHGITKYADDLLQCMLEKGLGGTRFIHLVGHSTGGIVIKRALVIANGSNNPKLLDIKSKCCSTAFFGTPHHGSTVLCQSTYKQAITAVLDLEYPITERVRRDLQNVETMDGMGFFSALFEPITINMEKIWSFYETMDTNLQVRARANGKIGAARIHRLVVEKRSTALDGCDSSRFPLIGCEELIPVKADHSTLPRFGDNPKSNVYRTYIEQLQTYIDTLAGICKEDLDARWLEHKLRVEVHRFHDLIEDNQMTVKLWSVTPTLFKLLESGPEACLNERVADAMRSPIEPVEQIANDTAPHDTSVPNSTTVASPVACGGKNDTKPALQIRIDTASPKEVVNLRQQEELPPHTASTLVEAGQEDHNHSQHPEPPDDDTQSDTSTPSAYSLPETYRFRWIHIPCNNPLWVDKLFLAVERERENRLFNKVAESTTSTSDDETLREQHTPGNSELSETPTEMLERPLENPLASHLLKAKELVEQKGLKAPGLKEALMNPRTQTNLLKLAQEVPSIKKTNSIPEAAQMVNDIRERSIIVDTLKQQIREGRSPDLSLINQKLLEDRAKVAQHPNAAQLSSAVLSKDYWLLQQKNSRHDLPHGRYMQHSCKVFLPKNPVDPDSDSENTLQHYLASIPSPIESPQLCVYLPYLHWDTFSGLQVRNDIVKRRMQHPVSMVRNSTIENGGCMENKLIWQYLVDKNNLPLHIRRTLDQFGQAHLENTEGRDQDQVLYKCTMPEDNDPFTGPIFHSAKNRASHTDDAKVLMVDQLWCWVIDSDTVTTFFTPREDLKAHQQPGYRNELSNDCDHGSLQTSQDAEHAAVQINGRPKTYSPGDLLYHLYTDVNGDQRFANRCADPFDFIALAVWHAITVFLDRVPDRDLQVFTLFEERLCELVEFRTSSFKDFRDSQIKSSEIFMGKSKGSAASRESREIVQALDPSYDLTAWIELNDIQDELSMLGSLFGKQSEVVSDLISSYELLDKSSDKMNHKQSIGWLKDAKMCVSRYQQKVEELRTRTQTAIVDNQSLLDMKQKQSNVIEAYFGRIAAQTQGEQNRTILIFTIFTVVFLPLSFFTSLFSMNVREWTGNDTNKTLHTVVTLMVSVSVFVIIAALLMAFFSRHIMEGTSATVQKTVVRVKNGHKHFQTLRNWWRRRRGKEEDEEEDDVINIEAGIASPGNMSWFGSRMDLDRVEQDGSRRRN
ncbi:hypothetical protein K458DRAFT_392364 [Lentithecium fluviatile CBS 122367]|uniref:DUF676 domain-containing protein n=1 Tax=Lentithecium fluviatile CBS 122367 TaxID=1168545 RepID=A0A6G1ITD8_9PLEO|nr:hypothetical protein K458DRAFT_392364 [Lentithecium fluviatile CBS 122367]